MMLRVPLFQAMVLLSSTLSMTLADFFEAQRNAVAVFHDQRTIRGGFHQLARWTEP